MGDVMFLAPRPIFRFPEPLRFVSTVFHEDQIVGVAHRENVDRKSGNDHLLRFEFVVPTKISGCAPLAKRGDAGRYGHCPRNRRPSEVFLRWGLRDFAINLNVVQQIRERFGVH